MALSVNGKEISPERLRAESEMRNHLDLNAKAVEDMAAELVMEALSREAVKEDIKALVYSSLPVESPQALKLFWDESSQSIITYVDGKALKVQEYNKKPWYKRLLGK